LKAKPKPKPIPKTRVKTAGISGASASAKALKAVKAAKNEGAKSAMKKVMKAKKAQADRILKSSEVKINRLLKENKARITEILRGSGVKRRQKATKKARQRNDNPFDARRFRGGRKKKETPQQRLKRLEDNIQNERDQILYGIATGAYKFKWVSVAKETGWGDGERKKMLSILDNKGYTINGLAKKIWEDNDGSYGRGKGDDVIRDEIIDVLQVVSNRTDALNQLDRGQGTEKVPF
jgi:hypothetical protein